ncbi:MAG: formylmethanofuran dehydrogenase subunit C [Bacillota bacterium]
MEAALAMPVLARQPTVLLLKREPRVPVEAETLNPAGLASKTRHEMERTPIVVGNAPEPAGDYFEVHPGEPGHVVLEGDLTRFKGIGAGMEGGTLWVRGRVGANAGSGMRSGLLAVEGDAGDWLGAQMTGGRILVAGNAGNYVGAGYRGYRSGMKGGTILVAGSVRHWAGARMRRGLIAVGRDGGDLLGHGMLAGTLLVCGKAGLRAGGMMRRGSIILLQDTDLLPSFRYDCQFEPPFWPLLCRSLEAEGFNLPKSLQAGIFSRYSGDINELGKGEILVWSGHG